MTTGNSYYHGWRHTVLRFSGHESRGDERRKRNLAVLLQPFDETVRARTSTAYPVLHFGNSAAANSSTAASHPTFAMLLFHPRTGDSISLLEVFPEENKSKERLDWIPGIVAAQRSDPGNTGSCPETWMRLWAHHNCAGITALAVCSAGAGSPWCLIKLPWNTKGNYFS